MEGNANSVLGDLIRKSYKKFKSTTYFDRTNAPVREHIIHFESSADWNASSDMERRFEEIESVLSGDDTVWAAYQENITRKIRAYCYPKKLEKEKNDRFYTTAKHQTVCVNQLQYMINLPVEGHILGTLWILLFGYQIDQKLYEHTYGNRIRKTLYNELTEAPTYSPHLFEPYFQQYQSWRDQALEDAQKCIQQNCDVVVLTLDLQRYFYSLDVTPAVMGQIQSEIEEIPKEREQLAQRLSLFIAEVCKAYAQQLPEDVRGNRSVLPIGFLPSNILSNWFLNRFDQAIVDHWNPLYYGRYVDDMLIVSKVESNSDIVRKAQKEKLTKADVIRFFLLQCTKWPGILEEGCNVKSDYALLQQDKNDKELYNINARYLPPDCNCKVSIQNEKVNIFYFQRGESDALLECFKQNIDRNVSEFRHMPEDDAIFQRNDYHEIYSLAQKGINKLRDVEDIEVDRFQLSKFLGKYLRIGGMIDDPTEHEFERDLTKIFDYRTAIDNYPLWERVDEILLMNEQFESLSHFATHIRDAIEHLTLNSKLPPEDLIKLKNTLYSVQLTGLTKALALCWKPAVEKFTSTFMASLLDRDVMYETFYDHEINAQHRAAWLRCRMADKSVMPVLPDLLLAEDAMWSEGEEFPFWNDDLNINLSHFNDVLKFLTSGENRLAPEKRFAYMTSYKYYPYMLTMHELSMAQMLGKLLAHNMPMTADDYQYQCGLYVESNYQVHASGQISDEIDACFYDFGNQDSVKCSLIRVGNERREKLRIALANVPLKSETLIAVLDRRPDRSYRRYQTVSKLVNQALDESADMLIMPEAFLPFEWLPVLARTCAKNQMAVITGIEHLVIGSTVYNLTATILPFQEHDNRCAQICFHLKNYYAPSELLELQKFRMESPNPETQYELFCWNDCWFSVYCCFELCSIQDRALFQSYADFLVAVEWNQDINHYGNIVKSLARDMHCYCVQVNEARYGDSRIVIPTRTEERDLIRIKGGKNASILVDEINIKDLRDFQFMGHSKIEFKPLPPQFDRKVVGEKRTHTLFDILRKRNV